MYENDKEIIKRHEGLSLKPYVCPTGHPTIGYGHNLKNGLPKQIQQYLEDHEEITQEMAEILLETDIGSAYINAMAVFPSFATLSSPRQHVLVNMIFNMGLWTFSGFKKFIASVKKGRWHEAGAQMQDSKWWTQVGNRAVELQKMLMEG